MTIIENGLLDKLLDLIGVQIWRYTDVQIFAILASILFVATLSLFLVFVFKLLVYIKKG